jgi:hypothetical protein
VKFLRQFAAVVAVVAAVVLIGLAWSHLAPSLPGENPAGPAAAVRGQFRVLPPGARLPPGRGLPPGARPNNGSGIPGMFPGDLLEPANLIVLRNNALLEAAVIAVVVLADAGYRRLRRARRAKTSPPRPGPALPMLADLLEKSGRVGWRDGRRSAGGTSPPGRRLP